MTRAKRTPKKPAIAHVDPPPVVVKRQQLSASKLAMASECPGSMALPAFSVASSKWARRGTAIHKFIDQTFKTGDKDAALKALPTDDLRELCGKINVDDLAEFCGAAAGEVLTEVSVAWDPVAKKGRFLESAGARDYSDAKPGEIPGQVDLVVPPADTILRFADWKTGYVTVDGPDDNSQMQLYALALASAYRVDRVEGMVVQINSEGDPWIQRATFDDVDLMAIAEEVRRAHAAVQAAIAAFAAGQVPEIRVGPWCDYCEAFPMCPRQAAAGQALIDWSERHWELTPDRAGEAWLLAKAVQSAADKVLEVIRDMAMRAPVPLPGGKELRPVEVPRESINGKITRDVLEEMGKGAGFFAAATISKAALARTFGEPLAAEILGRVRDRKGATTSSFVQLKALKVPKAKGGARG